MKIAIRLILLAALIALGVWLWGILFPSPEKIIRKRLAKVAAAASFVPNEGSLTRMVNVTTFGGYFSSDAQVSLDAPGRERHEISGRDEITKVAMAARNTLSSLKVEFLDMNVSVSDDNQSATVDLTAKADTATEKNFVVQEMKFILKKIDGEWLITRVETVHPLS